MNSNGASFGRRIALPGMAYAPTCELGVVYLFGRLAARLGFEVERVHPHFPDCEAIRRGKRVRVEFEFWASDYRCHEPKGADCVVCWENDWEHRPRKFRRLEIISLKSHAGALPRVFVVGCHEYNARELRAKTIEWNVPRAAQVDDLVLMYRPTIGICSAWRMTGTEPRYYRRHNRENRKEGLQAELRRVVALAKPLGFEELKSDPRTSAIAVVRKRFQGKTDVTADWPLIYQLIVETNKSAKSKLKRYVWDV